MFWFGKIVAALLLPPVGPLLVVIAGLACMSRRPRLGRALAYAGTGSLTVLSVPLVAAWLTAAVADADFLAPGTAVQADAIVLLGAGTRGFAPEYGTDAPTTLSLERVRYAARLAKSLGLPVAVSGGAVFGGDPEAAVLGAILTTEFGILPRWLEPRSRNTHENAVELAAILIPAGVRRVVVVTHGVDTRRGRREMQAAGFDVVMAPTVVPGSQISSVRDLVPSIAALRGSTLALYEMLGNLRATLGGIP